MGTINGARKGYIALGPMPALDGTAKKYLIALLNHKKSGDNDGFCATGTEMEES